MQGPRKRAKEDALPSTASLLSLPSDLRKVVLGKVEDFYDLCITALQNKVLRAWMRKAHMLDYWLVQNVGPDPALRQTVFWFVIGQCDTVGTFGVGHPGYNVRFTVTKNLLQVYRYDGAQFSLKRLFASQKIPYEERSDWYNISGMYMFRAIYVLFDNARSLHPERQIFVNRGNSNMRMNLDVAVFAEEKNIDDTYTNLTSHKQWLAGFLVVRETELQFYSRWNKQTRTLSFEDTDTTLFHDYDVICTMLDLGMDVFLGSDEDLTRSIANEIKPDYE